MAGGGISINLQEHTQLQLQYSQKQSEVTQLQEKCKLLESQYQSQLAQSSKLQFENSQLMMKLQIAMLLLEPLPPLLQCLNKYNNNSKNKSRAYSNN